MDASKRVNGRDLEILSAIGEGDNLTQRDLAKRLGVALGLTNLYLRRLIRKGYVKATSLNRRRLRYLLTSKGIAEKSRLTYEHMAYWAALYKRTRRTLREGLAPLLGRGMQRIVLYGTGEPAELAYLTLRELGVEPVGVFDKSAGGRFLGYPVRDCRELLVENVDGIIVATFERPDAQLAELEALGLPREKFVPLRPPGRPPGEAGAAL